MTLRERDEALHALDEYARDAAAGVGRFVVVAGEAGAGKTILVDSLVASLSRSGVDGYRVLRGTCDGLFTPRPLGPFLEVADQLGGTIREAFTGRPDRRELFSEVLGAFQRPGPVNVLVVEDVHWADETSLDLLRFLGRRVRGLRALVVVTLRDDGLAPTSLCGSCSATSPPSRAIAGSTWGRCLPPRSRRWPTSTVRTMSTRSRCTG